MPILGILFIGGGATLQKGVGYGAQNQGGKPIKPRGLVMNAKGVGFGHKVGWYPICKGVNIGDARGQLCNKLVVAIL